MTRTSPTAARHTGATTASSGEATAAPAGAGLAIDADLHLGVGVGTETAGAPVARPVLPSILVPTPLGETQPDVAQRQVEAGDRNWIVAVALL